MVPNGRRKIRAKRGLTMCPGMIPHRNHRQLIIVSIPSPVSKATASGGKNIFTIVIDMRWGIVVVFEMTVEE